MPSPQTNLADDARDAVNSESIAFACPGCDIQVLTNMGEVRSDPLLQWTENPTSMKSGLIRERVLRLVRRDPLTVHEEGEFQRALLDAGCRLTGPFTAEDWKEATDA
jgi:hypothetical protein